MSHSSESQSGFRYLNQMTMRYEIMMSGYCPLNMIKWHSKSPDEAAEFLINK